MAGASPRTEWLLGCVALDNKDLSSLAATSMQWLNHWGSAPPIFRRCWETNGPGVFAVGDVRSGDTKRVASAAGEGAIAVHLVHRAFSRVENKSLGLCLAGLRVR
jgi:thioredoxin reductase (NADPH)